MRPWFAAIIITCLSAGFAANAAYAKGKKSGAEPEILPCPIDEHIRVANAASLSRFTILAGCDDQIIEAEAAPEAPRAPVRIIPRFMEIEYPAAAAHYISAEAPYVNTEAGGVSPSSASDPAGILTLRPASYKTSFDSTIQQVALRHSVDPLLLHAVIKQESGYRQTIRSHAGALGLMQIMPATGASLGVNKAQLFHPESNIDAGARLLRKLYFKYSGNFSLVLAAYNAGEGAVAKYGNRVPPYRETQNYVKSVMAHYDRLVGELGIGGAGN